MLTTHQVPPSWIGTRAFALRIWATTSPVICISQIVTASARRVRSITSTATGVSVALVGSPNEVITAVLRSPSASMHWVSCAANGAAGEQDGAAANEDSVARIDCEAKACICAGS